MKPQNPIIKRDADIGWEIFVPPALLPVELRTVSFSPEGLYIEKTDDAWDLIPFSDMADLVACDDIPDDPMDFEMTNRSRLITKLLPHVTVEAGQPEPIITGQERMRRLLVTRHSETVTIEGTPSEIRELFGRAGYALPAEVDPQTLTVFDSRRYRPTGRVSDYGQQEMIDVRTGRRGVYHDSMGMGFVPGAYVTDSGRVEYEHPWDNPLQGCRF